MSDEEPPKKYDPTQHLIGHRFGEPGGADPREATKRGPPKWSVRKGMMRIAAHEFSQTEDPRKMLKEIEKEVFNGKMTGGAFLATMRFAQAMKNYKAMQQVVEDIDGKLIETKVEAKIGYAELVAQSLLEDDTLVTGEEDTSESVEQSETVES